MERDYPLKLSIIVPVYNVEQYLERCVESLLNQDIDKSEYEIILINDGSTDRSFEIAQRLVKENQNLVLLTQENKGLSGARNTGLQHVRGKYLMFVDSDDFLTENRLGKLISISEKEQLDLCFFRLVINRNDTVYELGDKQPFNQNKVYDGEYIILNGMEVSSACTNLYSSSFILDSEIRFTEGIVHEDIDFNFRLYPLAERVMFTNYYIYHYCLFGESITRTLNVSKIKHLIDSDFYNAMSIQENTKGHCYSKEIQTFYRKHGNSLVVSNLLLLINRQLPINIKFECLNNAKRLEIYPIHGRTNSWKTTLLGHLLNIEWLYRCLLNFRSSE